MPTDLSDLYTPRVYDLNCASGENINTIWVNHRDIYQDSGDDEEAEEYEGIDYSRKDRNNEVEISYTWPTEELQHVFEDLFSKLREAAAAGEQYEIQRLLSERIWIRENLNNKNTSSLAALHYAASWHYIDAARCLLLERADTIAQTTATRRTPLHLAVLNDYYNMAVLLLQSNTTHWARDIDGCTALHLAVDLTDRAMVAVLLRAGIAVNVEDNSGRTPLHIATLRRERTIIKLLIRRGADPELRDFLGKTAKDYAIKEQDFDVAAMLDQLVSRHGLSHPAGNSVFNSPKRMNSAFRFLHQVGTTPS
ncbi:hypothetical protein MMC18_001114 [Xylographa bjoerkii]|nr:hypothetical protein [Xylographa bjoerkii]